VAWLIHRFIRWFRSTSGHRNFLQQTILSFLFWERITCLSCVLRQTITFLLAGICVVTGQYVRESYVRFLSYNKTQLKQHKKGAKPYSQNCKTAVLICDHGIKQWKWPSKDPLLARSLVRPHTPATTMAVNTVCELPFPLWRRQKW